MFKKIILLVLFVSSFELKAVGIELSTSSELSAATSSSTGLSSISSSALLSPIPASAIIGSASSIITLIPSFIPSIGSGITGVLV